MGACKNKPRQPVDQQDERGLLAARIEISGKQGPRLRGPSLLRFMFGGFHEHGSSY
jgi:hypothetical protein